MSSVYVVVDVDEYEGDTVRGVYNTRAEADLRWVELENSHEELEGTEFYIREYPVGVSLDYAEQPVGSDAPLSIDSRCDDLIELIDERIARQEMSPRLTPRITHVYTCGNWHNDEN